jgi:hypothetical protein
MSRKHEQEVRLKKSHLGKDSIAYYSVDGKTFIFSNEKKCRKAISDNNLEDYAVYIIENGICIKDSEIF